jgi:hypothetical protein
LGTGVLKRVMREFNARTDIGGSAGASPGCATTLPKILQRLD